MDKFVFFSPRITFGVDFTVDTPQDMFIYVRGNSISPAGVFQQATRTRNIKTLYYHGECGNDDSHYNTLEDVYENIENCVTASKSLITSCTYVDDFDELKFSHNTFFKLFCYNEFVNDVFASNKIKHFECFLEQNGFHLSMQGEAAKLSKEEKGVQKDLMDQIADETFEEFLTTGIPGGSNIHDSKFKNLFKQITYLSLNPLDCETLRKFKATLLNKYRGQEHDDIIRLLKSTDHIDCELGGLNAKSIDAKLLNNKFQKAKLIQEFGSKFGITMFNLDESAEGKDASMDDGFFALIKQAFRITRAKPKTYSEVRQLFVSILRTATCRDIVTGKQGKTKKDRDVIVYTLNEGLLKYHLELNGFKNKARKGFAPEVVEKFDLQAATEGDQFLDDVVDALDA